MPTRTNKRTGEVQQLGPDGQWVTITPPSQPSGIQTRGPDLSLPDKRTITHNQAAASQFVPAKAQAETTVAQAQAANALAIAQAQRDKAVADAKTAEIDASGGRKLDPAVRAAALSGHSFAAQLQQVVDDLNTKFNAGPGATKGLEGLKDYLPLTVNQQFDTTANKSRGIIGQTLGFTGGQLNTPREAEQAIGPFMPQSNDRDAVIKDKIKALQQLADQGKAKSIQILGGEPDANGNIIPVTQGPLQTPAKDPMQLSGGSSTATEIDPTLKAVGTRVGQMLVNGTPDGKIMQFLRDSGVPPESTSVGQALSERKKPSFREWMRANPGQIYPVGPEFYTKQVPLTASRRLFNKAAATDIGGAAAAGTVAAGNAVLGDRGASFVGSLSGDPEAAKTGMEMLRTNHPVASFAGDLAGQGILEAGVGRIPGMQGLLASRIGRRVGDAAYGAYSGSGDNADDAGSGAVLGGLGGLGFGMAGRGVQKAVGNTLTGVRDAGVQYLHGKKIPMTLGQIARGVGDIGDTGTSNIADEVGVGAAGLEDRLLGLPGIEAWIKTARRRGDVGLNKEAHRQIASGVTGTGEQGLLSSKRAETAAYSKLNPVRIGVDPQFDQGVAAVEQASQGLSHHAGDVQSVIGDIRDQISNGEMTGKGYQTALRTIRKTRATLNDDVGGKAAQALDALETEMSGLGSRQGGQVAQDLAEANGIHARREVMKQAIRSPAAQKAGEMVSASGLNSASINNTAKFGGLEKALTSDRPFHELTTNGMKVMPMLTPDSGTAGRMALLGVLGGAGGAIGGGIGALTGEGGAERTGEGSGLGVAGGLTLASLLAAPYSRVGQKVIQHALLGQRPRKIQKLGDFLIAHPNLAGLLGQAGGRDYFQQPELPQ